MTLAWLYPIVHATMSRVIVRQVALGVAHIRQSALYLTELIRLPAKVGNTKGPSDRRWVE